MFKKFLITLLNDSDYTPKTYEELIGLYPILRRNQSNCFRFLQELEKMQIVYFMPNKTYILSSDAIIGYYQGKSNHFGFLIPLDKNRFAKDLFIHSKNLNGAMDGDLVIGKIIYTSHSKSNESEGKIISIIEEKKHKIVGDFIDNGSYAFVIPDNDKFKDIYINKEHFNGARNNDKVIVKIIKRAKNGKNPEGTISEILGKKDEVGMDIISIIRQYGLSTEFPNEVLKQIEDFPDKIDKEEIKRELLHRKDLRHLKIFTIDGEDTKDFDDAVSIEKLKNGNYKLGVHIADVTHYVKKGAPLDKEALNRGTSVYLVDRVLPMLPEKLSNGLCSLNPNTNRFALTCFMEINHNGEVVNTEIVESLINTIEKMTYININKIIEKKDEELILRYGHVLDDILMMEELRNILAQKRYNRGSIDFDFPEPKVILNNKKKPISIELYEKNSATNLIEEFMIVTNEAISRYFSIKEIPFLYRIHDKPSDEKAQSFIKFLNTISEEQVNITPSPKGLQIILEEYKNKKEYFQINHILLRSLTKAKYSNENIGHFGLASTHYSHFTSPIRRYPDLQIHRIIKAYLHGNLSQKEILEYNKELPDISKHATSMEMKANQCENDSKKLKMCEYMLDKKGQEFKGIVSGVTNKGIFVSLENTVEGFIYVEDFNMDKQYLYDEDIFSYYSQNNKNDKFTFGVKVIVQVYEIDLNKKQITFKLIEKIYEDDKEE
ncbi:ribonuclease R [Alkaliphilus sp. B6464]|uniref:ribonuclease R n=1 Tax=Alkaliphilus sp. B6464 TaxID=2731219 RepID=UPI001BAD5677|nr:ribonuclease R [Alkaliphilus sp. B6464]QUH21921.1 ribonuclease R [Alkaliphilus sp. B6464]